MSEKMGFETKKGFAKQYNNVRVHAEVGGKIYTYKSKLEYRWAQHLEFLKLGSGIKDWFYEFHTFYFSEDAPTPQYTPDFLIRNNDNSFEYYECKGYVEKQTFDPLKALFDEWPAVKVTIVFGTKPKLSAQKRNKLERYCKGGIIEDAYSRIRHEPIDMS